MADATYDAVIVGGGNKALVLGMYLTKYGGMKVGIFEARHELGGGWESVENSAPGFIANTHSFFHGHKLYRLPTADDFPEMKEKYGGEVIHFPGAATGAYFSEDETASLIFSSAIDPDQERTAAVMAKYSERDGEAWLKWWDGWKKVMRDATMEFLCTIPAPPPGGPEGVMMRMLQSPDCPIEPYYTSLSLRNACRTYFEAIENQMVATRFLHSAGISTESAGLGGLGLTYGLGLATDWAGFVKGGTHNIAHAAQRIIRENGGVYFTNSEVEKVIIENDTAKGIKLIDGTEVEATKLVATGVAPWQLIDLMGPEKVSPVIRRKIANLINDFAIIHWYWFALHEYPNYKAAEVMGIPEINNNLWVNPTSRDEMRIPREEMRRRYLHESPPYPDMPLNLAVIGGRLTEIDPSQAPDGKCTLLIEQFDVPANVHDEKWWLKHHQVIARGMIDELHKYAPNITWDTVIGWAPSSPYTIARLKNMAPTGNWYIIDWDISQMGSNRPIPELAGYKVPWIKGLYCTGSAWHGSTGANDAPGYNCYKVIAQDLGLRKIWEEKGRPY